MAQTKDKEPGRTGRGTFDKGNQFAAGYSHGPPTKRLSGRHWIRRALEIPEEEWPKVTFCAADANARKLVKELKALKGKDFVTALSTAHQDAYGQEARIEVTPAPDVKAASAEIARIESEIQRLLRGGK